MPKGSEFVPCYHCVGPRKGDRECGFVTWGCDLCRTYGNGNGDLKREYRYQQVEVTIDKLTTHFEPPPYECVWCQDQGTSWYPTWSSDFDTPKTLMRCHMCHSEEHNLDVRSASDPDSI